MKLPNLAFTPDVRALRSVSDTSPIRMVAYGGTYFAGFRSGGLFREGQLTSIPELVAHQMQLPIFESPVFQTEHGNGSGYYLFDKQASLPSWKHVTNQTAIVSTSPLKLLPFDGKRVDNIACPEGPIATADSLMFYSDIPDRRNTSPTFTDSLQSPARQTIRLTFSQIHSIQKLISYFGLMIWICGLGWLYTPNS